MVWTLVMLAVPEMIIVNQAYMYCSGDNVGGTDIKGIRFSRQGEIGCLLAVVANQRKVLIGAVALVGNAIRVDVAGMDLNRKTYRGGGSQEYPLCVVFSISCAPSLRPTAGVKIIAVIGAATVLHG